MFGAVYARQSLLRDIDTVRERENEKEGHNPLNVVAVRPRRARRRRGERLVELKSEGKQIGL